MADNKPKPSKTPTTETPKAEKTEPYKVLVFNDRGGFYQCNALEARKDKPTGAGKTSPEHQFNVTACRIPPGLFLLDGAMWDKVKDNPGLKGRVAEHQIVVVSDGDGPWWDGWDRMRPRQQIDMIKHTSSVETLNELVAREEDDSVAAELQSQIEICTSDAAAGLSARRAQRAHHRASGGRVLN